MTVFKYSHDGPYSSDRLDYNFVLLPSKREALRDQLVLEFSRIQSENGFRTDPYEVLNTLPVNAEAVKSFPTIVVLVGDEEWETQDQPRTILNSFVRCQVIGYFSELQGSGGPDVFASESAGEPLLDDMKRVFSRLLLKNVNVSGSRWIVQSSPRPRFTGPSYYHENRGVVSISFTAKLMFQSIDL